MKKSILSLIGIAIITLSCSEKLAQAQQQVATVENTAGKVIFDNACGKCHEHPSAKAFSDEKWVGIMKSMGPKAKLSADQSTLVLNYLTSNN